MGLIGKIIVDGNPCCRTKDSCGNEATVEEFGG